MLGETVSDLLLQAVVVEPRIPRLHPWGVVKHKPCQPRVTTTSIITKKAYREEQPERFLRKDTKEDISICLNCTRKSCSGSKRCLLKRKGEQNNVNQD